MCPKLHGKSIVKREPTQNHRFRRTNVAGSITNCPDTAFKSQTSTTSIIASVASKSYFTNCQSWLPLSWIGLLFSPLIHSPPQD